MSPLQEQPSLTIQRVGTVFIVDDEMMVTSSLQTMLSLETRHQVHCFNNPLDALSDLLRLKPDVVISDFSMPGMDGITFLRNVKKDLPEATLILLTGYADKESAIEAINTVGIYRYIEKPWDNEELKISINNGLERSYLINDLRQSVHDLTVARAELERTNHQLEALVEERTQDLKATYLKLQSIINNTMDGILTLDGALELTSLNPTAERWFREHGGYTSEEFIGTPLEHLLTTVPVKSPPKPPSKEILKRFDRNISHQVCEVFIGDLPLEAGIAPIPEEGGFVVVLRDITARKEIEHLRDDFVSTLTHDLRTPLLATIQTLGFFLDGSVGEMTERQQELTRMLIQSNREMLGLVNVLLEVYKYEAGRQRLIFDTVNLSELLGHVCLELEALAKSRDQTLISHLEPTEQTSRDAQPAYLVRGDKQELKRVLVNLIGNAIHYTQPGGRIEVSLAPEPPEKNGGLAAVRFCVSDNGRGIPAQDLPLLFQRFSQGTSKQRSSGSGLGLYLSRQIVEAHRGQIQVESEEGKGSCFSVILPAQGMQ